MTEAISTFPNVERIREIAAIEDAAIRNRWITWSYYQLNDAMHAVIGDRDLSWCGFAVWASNTAGTFIRQEEVPGFLLAWIDGTHATSSRTSTWLVRRLERGGFHALHFAKDVLGTVTDAIGGGNQNVFANIAPPFAELLTRWNDHGGRLDAEQRAAFLAHLRDENDEEQGTYLANAFAATFEAHDAESERERAQKLLYANACIGYVEQLRVQPYIKTALNAPIADLFVEAAHAHLLERLPKVIAVPYTKLVLPVLRSFAKVLEAEFRRLSTEWLMTLNLPEQKLRLGENVPPLADGALYPPHLDTLDRDQPLGIMEQIRATDIALTAAEDWQSFEQRMQYIGALFRSRQQERPLWGQPFVESLLQET